MNNPEPISPARINPWIQSWLKPRFAIRRIFSQQGENWIHRLMMLRGMLSITALRIPFWVQNRPEIIEVLILVLLVGPIAGLFFTYLYSGFLGPMMRKSLKLEVPNSSLRIGIAWSYIPVIIGTIIYCILCWALYPEVLPMPKPPFDYHSVSIGAAFMGAGFLLSFWIRVSMTSEISTMDTGRSFLFNLISLFLTDLPIFFFVYLYASMLGQVLDFS
jgi:hypothetical protein